MSAFCEVRSPQRSISMQKSRWYDHHKLLYVLQQQKHSTTSMNTIWIRIYASVNKGECLRENKRNIKFIAQVFCFCLAAGRMVGWLFGLTYVIYGRGWIWIPENSINFCLNVAKCNKSRPYRFSLLRIIAITWYITTFKSRRW